MGRVREEKKEDQKRESLLKRRVRSQLARWEMKNCTPLWREAHFEVKMYETHQVRTTFGSWDDEKVHGVVGGSTFRSQNAQTHQIRSTFRSRDVEKVHAVVARSTFRSQTCRKLTGSEHFWTFRCRFAWQVQGIVHLQKWAKREGFVAFPKTMAGVRRTSAKMNFPWQAQYKRHVHQRCWEVRFRGRRSTLDKCSGKIAKRIGTRPSALHSTFHFWRKSPRIVSFLMLSPSKNKEVSQNCFVFALVNFENWGSLAELFRFWRCQVQKLRKSRRTLQ